MSHNRWLPLTVWMSIIQVGLLGFAYFQFATRETGQFYGVLPNNTTFDINPLDRPNVSTKALLNWATLAATATFSFDFVNYREQLKVVQNYFTRDGFDNFILSLENAQILNTLEEKKLVLSAVAIGPAIIATEGPQGRNYTWRIQVPLLVRYQSANADETRQQVVDMLVTQVSTLDAPKGIGIAQYIAREAGPEASI